MGISAIRKAAWTLHGADLPERLWGLWQQGQRPDVHRFLADVGPVSLGDLIAVLRIDQQQRWTAGEPVSAEELERAKDNAKGRVVLALESTGARMERLGASLLAGMPILALDEMIERIEAVDAAAVGELAVELLAPERLSALRRVATIESIGSSTRIEGSRLSDRACSCHACVQVRTRHDL